MIEVANRIANIQEYYFSKKLEEIRGMIAQGHDVINLGIGSPDLPPSSQVVDALVSSAAKPDTHAYQSYKSIPELRDAIAKFYHNHYDVELDHNQEILPLLGSKEGVMYISMAFLNPGDVVLVPNPGYPAYKTAAEMMGAKVVEYDLNESNNWYPNIDDIDEAKEAKIMWINYPNMPTGQKASAEVYKQLVGFAKDNELLLVNDNPYSFILNDNPISLLSTPGAKEHCIELNSMSKAFNMAGWRVGMACGHSYYVNAILKAKSNVDSGMFRPVQEASIRALDLDSDWFEEINGEYAKRRKLAESLLHQIGCEFDQTQTGMFVWAKIPAGRKSEEFVDQILKEFHVFITPGTIFGSNGEGYIRISLCSKQEVFNQVSDRLKKIPA